MASGYGYNGGTARCHAYWQEFSKCYVQASTPQECKAPADDYMECLHHKKEIARAKTLKQEYLKKLEADKKDGKSVTVERIGVSSIPKSAVAEE